MTWLLIVWLLLETGEYNIVESQAYSSEHDCIMERNIIRVIASPDPRISVECVPQALIVSRGHNG